jgi:hypothetical protein
MLSSTPSAINKRRYKEKKAERIQSHQKGRKVVQRTLK